MELMVAMIALSIVVLVVAFMLIYGWTGWKHNTQSVAMQRDAMIAMNSIAREIRSSNIGDISTDAAGIYFDPVVARTDSATYLASSIAYTDGVDIKDFVVDKTATNVTVAFTLYTASGADQNDYTMTITPRN